jgi:hypothetical protein
MPSSGPKFICEGHNMIVITKIALVILACVYAMRGSGM